MDSPSDEQLARTIVRLLAAFVTLTLAGGIASASGRLGEEADEAAGDVSVGTVVRSARGGLGPLPGTTVGAYVRAAAEELGAASGRRAAVVSFSQYRTPEQADALVEDAEVMSWLVALPGGRPEELAPDRDLSAWTKGQRDEAAAEKKALEQLLPTVEDPDFERQYRADIDQLAKLLAGSADRRDVVFGAVVVARSDVLRAIGSRPGVRVVDVADDATSPPATASGAVRPEETVQAGEPPTRPTASP